MSAPHIKVKKVEVDLTIDWQDWEPFSSMVFNDGHDVQEFIDASDHIVRTIVEEAASGSPFPESFRRICEVQSSYAHLGFADSEGRWMRDGICRQIWGQAAIDYLGEYA